MAGLLEREMGHVQFVSMAWIPTYNARLSVCGGGGGEALLTIEVQWLVYVWRRREAYLMY